MKICQSTSINLSSLPLSEQRRQEFDIRRKELGVAVGGNAAAGIPAAATGSAAAAAVSGLVSPSSGRTETGSDPSLMMGVMPAGNGGGGTSRKPCLDFDH